MNLAATELKKFNYSGVYRTIYENKLISRQEIASKLGLSLPTVVQNINELLGKNLITEDGLAKSTGGRPSIVYKINELSRVSVGIEILPSGINLAIIDLYGNIRYEDSLNITFKATDDYFRSIGSWINKTIEKKVKDTGIVLGVDIAIPGILNSDKSHIIYSEVLRYTDFSLDCITNHINYQCSFMHDAEAGAYAELWHGEKIDSAFYLILNNYFCNALILNGAVFNSSRLSSGTIEHLIIHENGEKCYCGKLGCVDSYCSAMSLMKHIDSNNLDNFFIDLRNNEPKAVKLWDQYLDDLALTIDNARMIVACDIVIGGLLQKFITSEDIDILKKKVINLTTFKSADFSVKRGQCGKKAVIQGISLPRIKQFLDSI